MGWQGPSHAVAAGSLPAVEGGILPPGLAPESSSVIAMRMARPAGQDARLYGRHDACRYRRADNAPRKSSGSGAVKLIRLAVRGCVKESWPAWSIWRGAV